MLSRSTGEGGATYALRAAAARSATCATRAAAARSGERGGTCGISATVARSARRRTTRARRLGSTSGMRTGRREMSTSRPSTCFRSRLTTSWCRRMRRPPRSSSRRADAQSLNRSSRRRESRRWRESHRCSCRRRSDRPSGFRPSPLTRAAIRPPPTPMLMMAPVKMRASGRPRRRRPHARPPSRQLRARRCRRRPSELNRARVDGLPDHP